MVGIHRCNNFSVNGSIAGMEVRTMINWAILGFVLALGGLGFYMTRKAD